MALLKSPVVTLITAAKKNKQPLKKSINLYFVAD